MASEVISVDGSTGVVTATANQSYAFDSITVTISDLAGETYADPYSAIVVVSPVNPSVSAFSSSGITAPPSLSASGSRSVTTTSGQTSSATNATTSSISKNLSSGAIAGIGVSCTIAGAFITALAILLVTLCSKSRRKGRYQPADTGDSPGDSRSHNDGKHGATITVSIPENSSAAVIQSHLPPPAEERGIVNDFSKISDKVAGHVQGYYRISGLPKDASVVNTISQILGYDKAPQLHSRLPSLLADSNSRVAVLRAALAAIIIPRIDPDSGLTDSFLPPEVAGMIRSMGRLDFKDTVRMAFLSKYHSLAAFLLSPTYSATPSSSQAIGASDPRALAIASALNLADSILRPFSSSQSEDEEQARLRNLEEIMKRAARFAYVLVSQPTLWKFEGRVGASDGGSVVVWPVLVQVSDEEGRALRSSAPVGQAPAEGTRARFG